MKAGLENDRGQEPTAPKNLQTEPENKTEITKCEYWAQAKTASNSQVPLGCRVTFERLAGSPSMGQ